MLSRAFRSRFLELHVGDLPDSELEFILQQRCSLAPSYSKKLVGVMRDLYRTRQVSHCPVNDCVCVHPYLSFLLARGLAYCVGFWLHWLS